MEVGSIEVDLWPEICVAVCGASHTEALALRAWFSSERLIWDVRRVLRFCVHTKGALRLQLWLARYVSDVVELCQCRLGE